MIKKIISIGIRMSSKDEQTIERFAKSVVKKASKAFESGKSERIKSSFVTDISDLLGDNIAEALSQAMDEEADDLLEIEIVDALISNGFDPSDVRIMSNSNVRVKSVSIMAEIDLEAEIVPLNR